MFVCGRVTTGALGPMHLDSCIKSNICQLRHQKKERVLEPTMPLEGMPCFGYLCFPVTHTILKEGRFLAHSFRGPHPCSAGSIPLRQNFMTRRVWWDQAAYLVVVFKQKNRQSSSHDKKHLQRDTPGPPTLCLPQLLLPLHSPSHSESINRSIH